MKMTKDEAREHCNSHLRTLSDSLAAGRSEELQEYLAAMGRFHRYSFNNIMLILHQNPEATHVAGFHAWAKLGRQVKKGESGIAVIAPCRYKVKVEDTDTGDKQDAYALRGFTVAYVFDITQTEGDELPTFTELSGDPGDALAQAKAYARELGIELQYVPSLGGGRLGTSAGGTVCIKEGLDAATEFAVLVHELAHEDLHHGNRKGQLDKSVRETEAEAVASVVCSAFGVDSTARSSDYISLYRGTPETLSESLGFIQRTAEKLIDGIQSADVDASDSCESPVTVSQPAESSCNHTLDCRDQAGTWGTQATDDGRTQVVCVHCRKFYGYLDEPQDAPSLVAANDTHPDEDEQPEVLVTGRADYHERRDERIERYRNRAERRRSEADATYQQAKQMAGVIPFGQPILVGHHSEQRDRRYRERIHNTFGRSFELAGKAKYWEQRADAAESSYAISSDDPEALPKLREKLADLEHSQACMKAVNAAWRKAGKPEPTDVDGWARVAELQDLVSADDLNRLRVEYAKLISWVAASAPFPSYSLSNNNAEIRRLRERIAGLEASANAEHIETDRGVCRYVEDPEVNRVQLFFDGKPSGEIRTILKQNGFRFSKRNGNAWQRLLNDAGKRAADYVISQIQTLEAEECPA